MRGILQFMAIVALMVAARYVPLGDALRWLVAPAASPAIVTGSLQDEAHAGRSSMRPARDIAGDIRAILAQADARNTNSNARNERGPARVNRDEAADEEIYMGGTGLIDEEGKKEEDHPLAAAHPDDYIVICEAGCRPSSDRIVFQISKVSAAAAAKAQRKLEVTSVNESRVADAAANSNNEIVCIAGCYDDEPVRRRGHASNDTSAGVNLAEAGTSSGEGAPTPVTANVADEKTATADTAPVAVAAAAPIGVRAASLAPGLATPAPAVAETASLPASTDVAAMPAASMPAQPATAPPDVSTVPAVQVARIDPPATAAPLNDLASAHAISAETAAHLEAKRIRTLAKAAKPEATPQWQTTVMPLVALKTPVNAPLPIVALRPLTTPFETTVSVEHGWDFTLLNTP